MIAAGMNYLKFNNEKQNNFAFNLTFYSMHNSNHLRGIQIHFHVAFHEIAFHLYAQQPTYYLCQYMRTHFYRM